MYWLEQQFYDAVFRAKVSRQRSEGSPEAAGERLVSRRFCLWFKILPGSTNTREKVFHPHALITTTRSHLINVLEQKCRRRFSGLMSGHRSLPTLAEAPLGAAENSPAGTAG